MNHIYNLVWNESLSSWVPVAEIARSKHKGGRRSACKASLAVLTISGFLATSVYAELPATTVIPDGGKTNAYISANGVPVVNIETANAAGLSHNRYTRYDVEANGLVLNNGNNAQIARQSQLAGQVIANPNLVQEARVILNEVTSTNRSTLAGFTEVVGGNADVIVANPNGITCKGCGFINTDRATLTTGTSNIAADGSLNGFTVNRGDVLVEGDGANASTQQVFDIVARSTKVNGKINTAAGGSLGITTGKNVWDYKNRNVTGTTAGNGAAPSYAVDSTALGGMYAGRIRIVATEAGVGVRTLGDAAASADDFTLDSAGKVEVKSAISATRDIKITSSSDSGSQDISVSGVNGKLSANHDLALSAAVGEVNLNEGELYAANNLNLTSATLTDVSTTGKTRFAGGNNTLATTGATNIDGGTWGAGNTLSSTSDSLAIGTKGATIYAKEGTLELKTTHNLALAKAKVRSKGDMKLSSNNAAISTEHGTEQGIQTTAGDLTLSAATGITNAGTITADSGKVTARVSGALNNSGSIHAKTMLDIADQANGSTESVTNSGVLLADGAMTTRAANITNSGSIQATTGTVLSANNLTNSGTFIASDTAGADASLTLSGTFDNQISGTLQSKGALTVNATDTWNNDGKLLTRSVANGGSAGALTLSGKTLINSGTIDAAGISQLSATGSSGTVFTNSGILQGVGAMMLNTEAVLNNMGSIIGDAALSLTTGQSSVSVDNSGRVQSGGAMTLGSTNHVLALSNQSAGVIQSGGTLALTAGAISNAGTVQAARGTTASGTTFSNTGAVAKFLSSTTAGSEDNLTFSGAVNNEGTLQSAGLLDVNTASTLNNSGTIKGTGSGLALTGTVLTNSGFIDSSGLTMLTATDTSGTTINNSKQLHSDGALSLVSGGNVVNTGTGSIIGDAALSLITGQGSFNLDNSGRVQSGEAMALGSANHLLSLVNQAAGVLFSNRTLSLIGSTLNNQGKMYANSGTTLNVDSLTNGGASNSSALIFGAMDNGVSNIASRGIINNYGAIHSNDNFTISGTGITNRDTGGVSSLKTLGLTANTGNLDNYGALYAGEQLTAGATLGNLTNYVSTGRMDSSGSMTLTAGNTFTNNSAINASNDIAITAPVFRNEVPGGVPSRLWTPISWNATFDGAPYTNCGDGNHCHHREGYTQQYFATPLPDTKPQIIAGRNMGITGFSSAYNTGALLSASSGNMTISGVNGSTFTNDDLSLQRMAPWETWRRQDDGNDPWGTYDQVRGDTPLSSYYAAGTGQGAGIFARNLTATGFALVNQSSVWGPSVGSRSASASTGTSATGVDTVSSLGMGSRNTVVAGASLSFAGLNLTLPSSPNGYFVAIVNPSAEYLIESNPLFKVGSVFVGSDYMAKRYGYNPDTVIKRLGDSNYEAYLIRQQLIQQTGNNMLKGYGSETAQMQRLMDQAVKQGKELGLTYGKALSPSQSAALKEDLVWMEESIVAGQKVLVPRVYLAQSTKDMIKTGAVIAANDVKMDLTSLRNTGGTIAGSDKLDIASKGDITNTSGTITGGDVSLKSTEGSINNETVTSGSGNDKEYRTSIARTAGITATGNLNLDAKKDIKVIGGDVEAGGDASLSAGKGITFDTIVDKSTSTSRSGSSSWLGSSTTITTTSTEKNVGSNLKTGGTLTTKSGGDTTIAGSNVVAGGGMDVDAGGSFNVLARQDKTTTHTTKTESGFGVGGGLYGSTATTTDNFKGTNKGSTIQVGSAEDQETRISTLQSLRDKSKELSSSADSLLALKADYKKATPGSPEAVAIKEKYQAELATYKTQLAESKDIQVQLDAIPSGDLKVKAENSMTLQGSNLNVAGDADIDAKEGINILDGLDETRTTSTTTTSTFMKLDGGGSQADGTASGSASETVSDTASAAVSGSASGSASADYNMKLTETSTTKTNSGSKRSVASNLNIGGNLRAKTDGTITVQGSNVSAGGDLDLDAKNINVLTGRNETFSDTHTTTESTGLYAKGNASGSASGSASDTDSGSLSGSASGSASGNAAGAATIGGRTEESRTSRYNLTNSKSSIKAGGNMAIKAKNDASFVGSDIESGGDMSIDAKSIRNSAARDVSTSTSSNTQTTSGLYVGAEANANGNVDSSSRAASGAVNAEATAGIRQDHESSKTSSRSETSITNTFKAGGNIKRVAQDTIRDEGTSLDAGGNIEQSARVIEDVAIHDTTVKSASAASYDARLGASYKSGEGYGVKGSYQESGSSKNSDTSTAVTSKYNAGGSITSKSTEKTTLVGTNFKANGDVDITAGSLDYQDASDSTSSTSSSTNTNMSGSVTFKGKGEVSSNSEESKSKDGSTTRRSGIIEGRNITINNATTPMVPVQGVAASQPSAVIAPVRGGSENNIQPPSQGRNISINNAITPMAPVRGGAALQPSAIDPVRGSSNSSPPPQFIHQPPDQGSGVPVKDIVGGGRPDLDLERNLERRLLSIGTGKPPDQNGDGPDVNSLGTDERGLPSGRPKDQAPSPPPPLQSRGVPVKDVVGGGRPDLDLERNLERRLLSIGTGKPPDQNGDGPDVNSLGTDERGLPSGRPKDQAPSPPSGQGRGVQQTPPLFM
ncbi:MAG: hemagglutinin repeat-containing protein [Thiothrix sp.]|uniref:two-partner secretion domain-containing protein n=1 Tax=Thiothrix sp. TaxID=1032 RepID=UPI00261580CE|nr:hemagglutinin repeat-containing protein [Thiothrix sp.]MDD5394880.1 hemagglutinin repeat-containing protein [Thiothrix sp.]